MPYEDDDDLFGEDFDFVDDDDDDVAEPTAEAKDEDSSPPVPRRRPPAKGRPEKPPVDRPRGRGRSPAGPGRRNDRQPVEDGSPAPVPDPPAFSDDAPVEEEVFREEPAPAPMGPPADHVVHIYEYGKLKRTIPRKFTDEEAVGFAEEYTRTGKAYGRYAVATPEDEEPSPTFAGASRGG